jgi:aminoglycoside phosphotransferase (APT) family kinase protein
MIRLQPAPDDGVRGRGESLNRHLDRPIQFADSGDRLVVIKRFVHGVPPATAQTMVALWNSPFGRDRQPPGLPEVVDWDEHSIVMERVDGDLLGVRGDPGQTVERLDELAALLVGLHTSGVATERRRSARGLVRSIARKRAEVPLALQPLFSRALKLLAENAPDDERLVVSHGDFSPRNVIVSPTGLRLIDFDRVQMASPARDVSYLGAWLWVTALQQTLPGDALPAWDNADRFVAAYDRHIAMDRAHDRGGRVSLRFHRAASLLRIAHGWSALQANINVNRLVIEQAIRQLEQLPPSAPG